MPGEVSEPGTEAVGTVSLDVGDGVVRKATRAESPCATVNFQLTSTKPPAITRWLFTCPDQLHRPIRTSL